MFPDPYEDLADPASSYGRSHPWNAPPPSPETRLWRGWERLRILGGLLGIGSLIAVGPFATSLATNVRYRAALAGPPNEGRPRLTAAIRDNLGTIALLSWIPALFWLAGMVYAATLL